MLIAVPMQKNHYRSDADNGQYGANREHDPRPTILSNILLRICFCY